ncbi:MAG: hypothetical protein ACI86H_001176 [bacterium]|jgi:hypothetical protein
MMKKIVLFAIIILGISNNIWGQTQRVTPSHVYQKSIELIKEIQLIRRDKGLKSNVRSPGVQSKRTPIHVFGKTLEVLYKISNIQSELGLTPVQVQYISSSQKITPASVYHSIRKALQEIRKVKQHYNISRRVRSVPFVDGKRPSDAYEKLWFASYLLDTIGKPLSPNHVYRNTLYILNELKTISSSLGKGITQTIPQTTIEYKIIPKDVLIESYKNLYRLAKLEIKLQISPITPSSFPTGKIIPSDPYDATSTLISELTRIKKKLGITSIPEKLELTKNQTPLNILLNTQLIGKNLEQLTH